jgi:hypothetical protein
MRHRTTGPSLTADQLYRLRGWLYRVAVAAALLLAGYGMIEGDRLPLWLALAGAVFGNVTAALNTPTRKATP